MLMAGKSQAYPSKETISLGLALFIKYNYKSVGIPFGDLSDTVTVVIEVHSPCKLL